MDAPVNKPDATVARLSTIRGVILLCGQLGTAIFHLRFSNRPGPPQGVWSAGSMLIDGCSTDYDSVMPCWLPLVNAAGLIATAAYAARHWPTVNRRSSRRVTNASTGSRSRSAI